jgi:hypothetical protein
VLRLLYIVTVLVCVPCVSYLLLSPMEKEEFFLTRWLAQRLFPKLERDQRQLRLQYIAGFLMSVLITASAIAFIISRFGLKIGS